MQKTVLVLPPVAPARPALRTRLATAALVAASGALVASAQTTDGGTQTAEGVLNELALGNMITTAGRALTQLVSDNAPLLIIAILPVLAFFFIWNRVRSLF